MENQGQEPQMPMSDAEDLNVSIIALIANPAAHHGRHVRVYGYLHIEFEINGLFLHKEDYRHSLTRNGLWVEWCSERNEPLKRCSDHYALIEGVFDAKFKGHMSLWSGAIRDVNRCDLWEFPREPHRPSDS